MVTQMTNRLLATVMAFAVSTGLAAHAARDTNHNLPALKLTKVATTPEVSQQKVSAPSASPKALTLPSPASVPQAIRSAANHLSDAATAIVDPSAAVRGAYQRDQLALEHLRQQGSALKGEARQAFNQRISEDELQLVQMERIALASKGGPATSIAAMDQLVLVMRTSLDRDLSHSGDQQTGDNNHQSDD